MTTRPSPLQLVRRTVGVAIAVGFLTWVVFLSISPLAHWTQEVGSCRGADKIERDVRDGGDVRSGGRSVGTTVFELRCSYDNGERVELIGNDEAVLRGMLVGFLIGAVPAAALYLARHALRSARGSFDRPEPS
jgi:energy-converting hydrogenase Eha subunit B